MNCFTPFPFLLCIIPCLQIVYVLYCIIDLWTCYKYENKLISSYLIYLSKSDLIYTCSKVGRRGQEQHGPSSAPWCAAMTLVTMVTNLLGEPGASAGAAAWASLTTAFITLAILNAGDRHHILRVRYKQRDTHTCTWDMVDYWESYPSLTCQDQHIILSRSYFS